MVKFNPEGKADLTIGEIFRGAMKAETKEEAKQYLDDYAAHIQKLHDADERYRDEALDAMETARHNIGYLAGYYDEGVYKRILDLFEVSHPIFGKSYPSPKEAFKAGMKAGVESM
jgi:hypothetical protein